MDARQNFINRSDTQKWDTKEGIYFGTRRNPSDNHKWEPKKKLLRMLGGTISKH